MLGGLSTKLIVRTVERGHRPDGERISLRWDRGYSGYSFTYLHSEMAAAIAFGPSGVGVNVP